MDGFLKPRDQRQRQRVLTRPAEQNGDQRIYGQIVPGCKAHGTPGPNPGPGPGPYIIQLYKDPDSGDA